MSFQTFLKNVVQDPQLETEWLDLLSQLEYVGARKILKAVSFEDVSISVLRHLAEESSHALLLKRVVENRQPNRQWSQSKWGPLGFEYFSELDRCVSALVNNDRRSYPLVSWIVERRVLDVYPRYQAITREPEVRQAITEILQDEVRHGRIFDTLAFPLEVKKAAQAIEAELWEDLTHALNQDLGRPACVASIH